MSIAPSEARSMEPRHFWWLMEDLLAEQAAISGKAGKMSNADKDDLLNVMRAEGANI